MYGAFIRMQEKADYKHRFSITLDRNYRLLDRMDLSSDEITLHIDFY